MNARTSSRLLLGSCVALGLSIAGAALDAQAPAGGRQGGAAQTAPPIPADAKVPGPTEVPGAVKGYTAPKTPVGRSRPAGHLAGHRAGRRADGARPRRIGARNWLTDEEFKQRQAQRRETGAAGQRRVRPRERREHARRRRRRRGVAAPHWLERGTPQRIGSLIVDPVDGQQPPRVQGAAGGGRQGGAPAAGCRRPAPQPAPRRGPADSYTDRSLYDRCITRGIAGSFLPVIYNNGNEIVQGPGWVALRNEMIHETRIVPLDNRPKIGDEITQFMGDSRGHWDGNTLVVVTTNFNDRTSGIGVNGSGRHSHGDEGDRAHHSCLADPARLGHDLR